MTKKTTQYQRGTRKEYELAKELRKTFPIVIRAAGSHGEYDILAIDPQRGLVEAYQVKYVEKWPSPSDLDRMLSANKRIGRTVYFQPRLRVYLKGNGYRQWPE